MARYTIEFEGKIAGLATAIDTLKTKFDTFAQNAAASTAKTASSFEDLGKKIERSISSTTSSMARWGLAISALATGGGLAALIKRANEFEVALADVATILNDNSTPALQKWNDQLMDLSKNSTRSVLDLTKGLYEAISSGVDTTKEQAKTWDLLVVAQKAATAGLSSTSDAVRAGASVMNIYGKEAGTTTEIYDKMMVAVKSGMIHFPELAKEVGTLSTKAKAANVTFEEMLAALVEVSKGMGGNVSEAATALGALFTSLSAPGMRANKEVEALGINLTKQAIAEKGLAGVVVDTQTALVAKYGENAAMQRKLLQSTEARIAFDIIARNGTKDYITTLDAETDSRGKLAEMYSFQEHTATAAWQRMINAFDRLAIGVKRNGKDMGESIDAIVKVIDGIDTKKLAEGIAFITDALKVLIGVLGGVLKAAEMAGEGLASAFVGVGRMLGIESLTTARARNTSSAAAQAGVAARQTTETTPFDQALNAIGGGRPADTGGPSWTDARDKKILDEKQTKAQTQLDRVAKAAREQAEIDAKNENNKKGSGGDELEAARKEAEQIAEMRIHIAQKSIDQLLKMGEEKLAREISEQMDAYGTMVTGSDRLQKQISGNIDAEQKAREAKIKERLVKELADAADNADARASFEKAANLEIQASDAKAAKQRIDLAKITLKQTQELIARRTEMEHAAHYGYADKEQARAEAYASGGVLGLAGQMIGGQGGAFVGAVGKSGLSGALNEVAGGSLLEGVGRISGTRGGGTMMGVGNILTAAAAAAGAKFYDLVSSAGSFLYDKLTGFVDLAGTTNTNKFPGAINDQLNIARNFVDNLIDNLPKLFAALEAFVREMGPKIAKAIPVITHMFIAGIPPIMRALIAQLPALMDALIIQIPDLISAVVGMLPMLIQSLLAEVVPRIPDLAAVIVIGVLNAFASHIDTIIGAFISGLEKAFDKLINKILKLIPGGSLLSGGGVGDYAKQAQEFVSTGGLSAVGDLLGLDIGGKIESYARGGMVGRENAILGGMRDVATRAAGVPAVVHPGERILRAETTKRIEGMLEQAVAAGTGGGDAAQVVFQSMGGKGDRLLMELISHYVTASVNRNGRLISNVRQMAEGPGFVNYPRPIPALGY